MNTLYINYTKNGTPIADCNVEERVLAQASLCKNGQDKEFRVSTENAVICARMMKITGKIECELKIMFEGNILDMNRYGVIINGYPYGFCDYVDRWTVSLLQAQMSLKKSDSELLNNKDNER